MTLTSSSGRRWPWLFAWALLTVYFVTPPRDVADQSLDKSNYATYAHFFTTAAQWGADVIPMTGPYGFVLYGHTYSGEAFWPRFFGDLVLKAVFAALLLHLFHRAGPGLIRWLWLAGVVIMVPTVDDLFHDYAILLAGLVLLTGLGERRRGWSWLAAIVLGLLALFKGTHLLTTAVIFGVVVVAGLIERRPRQVLALAALYLGSLAGFWLLARQNLLNLPAYVRGVLDLSAGYNATMGYDEPPVIFCTGLGLASGLFLLLVTLAGWTARTTRTRLVLLLLAGFSFIKWKHGFLRADGHVDIFFAAVSVLALTASLGGCSSVLGAPPPPLSRTRRAILLGLGTAVVSAAVIATAAFSLRTALAFAAHVPGQLQDNARYLAHPRRVRMKYELQLAQVRRDTQAPQIQAEVESDAVDFFGYEEGILLLNHLAYHPRPMGGGSFNVFTPRLQRLNAAFMADPARAPAWEVVKLQTLDDRLPAADDPLTLQAILHQYSPVLLQRDYLLLKRLPEEARPAEPVKLQTVTVRAGENFPLPAVGPDRLLLFTLEAPLSLTGRLRTFFYRSPALALRVTTDRYPQGRTFALKPLMLQSPVILSPLLEDNRDLLLLYGETPGNRVHSFRFDPAPGFASNVFSVTFYTAPRPAPPKDTDVAELLTYRRYPLYNRTPISLVTQETGIRELALEPITLVHAPGSITWELKPDDQQVLFSYGLYPAAYLEGNTDGVEFNVEVIWPPKDGRVLFKRMLTPYTYLPDRGMHRARVYLPPYRPGALLRIRTHPGPANNGAYDQSYITRLQIKSGQASAHLPGMVPEQFNGLGVVPANGLLPDDSVASVGGRPVYLLHAPNEVVLNVPAGARRLTGEIGLLPGAYTGGGNSDGVEFTVYALPPGGTRTKLWSRYLDPVRLAEDRGPQSITVVLPKLPAGSQLAITTGVGPHGNRSWDHSYVAGVKLK
jgi:hypothetical protein